MEFIRHTGELQCSGCSKVESNRNIYYAIVDGKQVYWFVCGDTGCGEWTRVSFGYEEAGPLAKATRRKYPKIKQFDETGGVSRYGTNW
jgi:hypothetical protein